MMGFKIHWRSGLTGAEGCGNRFFGLAQAKAIVHNLNKDPDNKAILLDYWYEWHEEPDEEEEE